MTSLSTHRASGCVWEGGLDNNSDNSERGEVDMVGQVVNIKGEVMSTESNFGNTGTYTVS